MRSTLLTAGYVASATAVAAVLIAGAWFDPNYETLANVSMAAAAVMVNLFTVVYAVRARWRTNPLGRVFLLKCVGMSAFLTQAAVTVWIDRYYPHRQEIRFAIYTLFALWYAPMLAALAVSLRRNRDDDT